MSMEQSLLNFMNKLNGAYLEDRDIEFVLSCLDPEIVWNGIGTHSRGLQETKQMLLEEQALYSCSYTIRDSQLEYTPVSEQYGMLSGSVVLQSDDKPLSDRIVIVNTTALCQQRENGIKLRQIHISSSNQGFSEAASASFYERESHQLLRRLINQKSAQIQEKDRDLQTLIDNIPGGMFRCLNDGSLTLLYVSDGFLSMFGYTRAQISERFHDHFLEMVDPRDKESALEDAKRQMALGTRKEMEYRVICADGSSMWVLDKGQLIVSETGQQSFCCIIVDVTNAVKAQEELQISLESHRIIMDQTNDILFEWDIATNHMTFSHNWEKKFGYLPVVDNPDGDLPSDQNILQQDRSIFIDMLRSIQKGKPYNEQELRILCADGDALWCRMRITTQFDAGRNPIKAVGVIIDINREKKRSEKLLEKAERDALTKLYNKGTTQNIIENYLSTCDSKELNALMIIDVDDFKQVNDSQGHLFGDAVLTQIAQEIQKLFRTIDVIGRVGGDEFIVFLKGISGESVLQQRANQIIKVFQEILNGQDRCYQHLSCSIGIALYPFHGKSFQDLYHRADHALYHAKKRGKNQFVVYTDDMLVAFSQMSEEICSVVGERIDSNEGSDALNSKLMEYVFRILYKSQDIDAAMNSLLEIVGRQFDISRVYIFENSEDNLYCSNTFEWCNEGVLSEIDNLQHVNYEEDLDGNYTCNFDEDGIFYCPDISQLSTKHYQILKTQEIKSLLQCAIRDNGQFRGFVGFDECRRNRLWNQEQINVLTFISEILSTFLIKKRAQDQMEQTAQALLTVLDNQNSWIYVINCETYEMYFINRKTKELVPNAELGMRCYESFFNRSSPCAQCPMRSIKGGQTNCTMEIYNPVLHVWSAADASFISWKGHKACLLSCRDITSYKLIKPEEEDNTQGADNN